MSVSPNEGGMVHKPVSTNERGMAYENISTNERGVAYEPMSSCVRGVANIVNKKTLSRQRENRRESVHLSEAGRLTGLPLPTVTYDLTHPITDTRPAGDAVPLNSLTLSDTTRPLVLEGAH